MHDGTTQVEYVRDRRIINAYIFEKKRIRINQIDVRDLMLVDQILDDENEDPQIRAMLADRWVAAARRGSKEPLGKSADSDFPGHARVASARR
jgi:hypothetical protein